MSRLFVALPVPDSVRQIMTQWMKALERQFPFQRWVHADDIHITLKFLGDTPPDRVDLLQELLGKVSGKTSPWMISVSGLGVFGPRAQPTVLWAGIQPADDSLPRLQQRVELAMEEAGFAREQRAYHPHLTLARKFRGSEPFQLQQLEVASRRLEMGHVSWEADQFVLYESHPGRRPMYEAIGSYRFRSE